MLHLGGTKILGVLLTMDAAQGSQIIRPRTAIPIHYNDYTVFKSTPFKQAVEATHLETKVRYLHHGDTYTFKIPI
jgi:L-ascorbate metabolism protein UlaG (beta-lactamase superfamily)